MQIGSDGFGTFNCNQTSVSVYVNEAAEGRDQFGKSYVRTLSMLTCAGRGRSRLTSINPKTEMLWLVLFAETEIHSLNIHVASHLLQSLLQGCPVLRELNRP